MKLPQIFCSLVMFLGLCLKPAYASNPELNETLVRVIHELNAILPLLDEARDELKATSRIQFHVDTFKTADGKTHAGLRDDVLKMREALIAFINEPALAPKDIKPLALDYIGKVNG